MLIAAFSYQIILIPVVIGEPNLIFAVLVILPHGDMFHAYTGYPLLLPHFLVVAKLQTF